jgi:hypothetical protein
MKKAIARKFHDSSYKFTLTSQEVHIKLFGLVDVVLIHEDLVTATHPSMDPLSTVRAEIKAWERSFKSQNARDPTINDIKRLSDIGQLSSFTYALLASNFYSFQPTSTSFIRSFQSLLHLPQLPLIHHQLHPENALHHHAYLTFYLQTHAQ